MMAALKYITQGGHWPHIALEGSSNEDNTNGLVIDAPGQVVSIGTLAPSVCNVPLIVRNVGKLLIEHYQPHHYWGDTANIRASHIFVNHWKPRNIQKQRRSYEEYHHDLIFQAYATQPDGHSIDPDGVIEHIHINHIDVESELTDCNGIMLSECNTYRHFHIGSRSLNIKLEAKYWLNANTLSDSVIGGGRSDIGSLSGHYEPSILLTRRKACNVETNRCLAKRVPHAEYGSYPDKGVVII